MRVLVCGGRDFRDNWQLYAALDDIAIEVPISCIIQGCAPGADTMAGEWAAMHGIAQEKYPAEWAKHGPSAGPIRNKLMLTKGKPDIVVAFPGGRGTTNMTRQAESAGVKVIEIQLRSWSAEEQLKGV